MSIHETRRTILVATVTLLTLGVIPIKLGAQLQNEASQTHRYIFVDLGTLGGPNSYVYTSAGYELAPGAHVLNNRGILVGQSDTPVSDPNYPNFNPNVGQFGPMPFIQHAFKWRNGVLTDLGALPGLNDSSVSFVNATGVSAGISTNGSIDPLTGWPAAVAVLWNEDGQIANLGTLGGNESAALAINDNGQVVGMASNAIPDSLSGYGTQQRAFLWHRGVMRDLGTLGGPDAGASMINNRGQIVGASYTDSIPNPLTGIPTFVPFLWQDDTMINLGGLGGAFGLPLALNSKGQVVGFSDVAGDLSSHPFFWNRGSMMDLGTFGGDNGEADFINDSGEIVGSADFPGDQIHHAFLWKDGLMTDLGTVAGDPCSRVTAINSKGQIIGGSSDCQTFLHAYLWENGGPMIDLNTFVPPGSDLTLTEAGTINDRGEIEATGVLPNGDFHAVMLIPCDAASADTRCHRGGVKLPAAKPSTARADALGMVPAFLRARQRSH